MASSKNLHLSQLLHWVAIILLPCLLATKVRLNNISVFDVIHWTLVPASSHLQCHPRQLQIQGVGSCGHTIFASVLKGQLQSPSICSHHCGLHSHFFRYSQLALSQHGPSFQRTFCSFAGRKNQGRRGSLKVVNHILAWIPLHFLCLWFCSMFDIYLIFLPPPLPIGPQYFCYIFVTETACGISFLLLILHTYSWTYVFHRIRWYIKCQCLHLTDWLFDAWQFENKKQCHMLISDNRQAGQI